MTTPMEAGQGLNFIQAIIEEDQRTGKHSGRVHTRFPPEPNGYLHIGHAKAISLNFGLAQQNGGKCNLRLDDTNPTTEETEYVESIQEDIRWLGFTWDGLYYASDYFGQLYQFAEELIRQGKAYVDDLKPEEISQWRGDFTTPGRDSPFRNRSVEENLDLFRRMRAGEFPDGARTLRAKIDMRSPNPNLRDPAIYRIRHAHHHRTGDAWCIYPLYDFAHCLSDAIEGITHSICTLEFENRRVLYDWIVDTLVPGAKEGNRPYQYEMARLNLTYTVMSKRKLKELVDTKVVDGWDDPRMLTIRGLRRRGFTAASLRDLTQRVGVTKTQSRHDIGLLEQCVREDLDTNAPRAMAVLRPLKVVLENYPEGQTEELPLANHPKRPELGTRQVPFMRELYIEQDDFMENPPKGFYRLSPGVEVRLRGAYFIRCERVIKDADGRVVELRCTYDPATRGGNATDRKVKGTLHWVPASAPVAEVRLYDRLFAAEDPEADEARAFKEFLNPDSLEVLAGARVEPMLAQAAPESHFQFERLGYFYADPKKGLPGRPVFNRTVTLKDSWVREQGKA